jgi:parvin
MTLYQSNVICIDLSLCLLLFGQVLSLPRWSQQKWSVESVHSKNIVAILHLLVALARHFRAPVRLPENVAVGVVVVQVCSLCV